LRSGGIDSVAFDERNSRRIAVGTDGMIVTNDLGATWTTSTFDSNPAADIVVFSAAFSADGQTIWAHGRNIDEFVAGNPNDGRHLWQSTDGGATFSTVAEQNATVKIMNFLVAHPSDPNLVYWSGGVFGDPTTHLYRFSKADGTVTRVLLSDGTPYFDVHRFAFHPTNPSYLYFGLIWPGP
jgi:outer membrane protein assembly factor BamB